MELKIKIPKGNYALRIFDKDGLQIFYTSTRIGGLSFEKDSLTCTIPDASVNYELKDLSSRNIAKKGSVEIYKPKNDEK